MLSILTNFGCHWSCTYCVYRENGIKIPRTTEEGFNWFKLEQEIMNMEGDEISISGGGDPLYNYKDNQWFYDRVLDLATKYNKKLELHTTYIDYEFDYSDFDRIVFHMNNPTQIRLIDNSRNRLWLPTNVRVVFVLQPHYNEYLVNHIIEEVKKNSDISELVSFRQLIDNNGQAVDIMHDKLKERHLKDLYYIEQCDYNDYFVNDHIEKEYLEIK